MDGVVADFNGYAQKILKASDQEAEKATMSGHWSHEDWQKLKTIPHFYKQLPKTPEADEIIDLARKFRDELGWNLYMLTAIPSGNDVPDAIHDKVEWIQQYYPDIPVHFGPYSRDKHKHAKPGDILVDDRRDNCQQWQQAQGVAILSQNRSHALKQLKQTLETDRQAQNPKQFLLWINYMINDIL